MIKVTRLSYSYSKKSPLENKALRDIDLTVNEGEFLGIIGHTGSGKSTLIQHFNGLLKLQTGKITVGDIDLSVKKPDYKRVLQNVGMVFQYPEYQLFADTVRADVAFGPQNLRRSAVEIEQCVKEAITAVGLDYETIKDMSPFSLSGGQKRRVAIAGVIAMRPKILVLDEPTAGLDPAGKEQILAMITELKRTTTPTVIVISHDIDEIARYADRIVVMNEGRIEYDVPMEKLFQKEEELRSIGLDVPIPVKLRRMLKSSGIELEGSTLTPLQFVKAVVRYNNSRQDKKRLDESVLSEQELEGVRSETE